MSRIVDMRAAFAGDEEAFRLFRPTLECCITDFLTHTTPETLERLPVFIGSLLKVAPTTANLQTLLTMMAGLIRDISR